MSTLTTSVQLIYSDWYPQSLITIQEFLVNLPQFTTKENPLLYLVYINCIHVVVIDSLIG
jgi:hypothetical protein